MKVILATIPSDSHTWNLVFMHALLTEKNCSTVNLGACTPIQLLIDQALIHRADLIVISSINGHGNIDGVNLAKTIRSHPSLRKIDLVIGGKLGTIGDRNIVHTEKLLAAGFNRVFQGENSLVDFQSYLSDIQFNVPQKINHLNLEQQPEETYAQLC